MPPNINPESILGWMEFRLVSATLCSRRCEPVRNMWFQLVRIHIHEGVPIMPKQGVPIMTNHSTASNDSMQASSDRPPPSVARIPWWVSIVVILGALLMLSGAVISKVAPTVLTNGSPMTDAARIYADYLF